MVSASTAPSKRPNQAPSLIRVGKPNTLVPLGMPIEVRRLHYGGKPNHLDMPSHVDVPSHVDTLSHMDVPSHVGMPSHMDTLSHMDRPGHVGMPIEVGRPIPLAKPNPGNMPNQVDRRYQGDPFRVPCLSAKRLVV